MTGELAMQTTLVLVTADARLLASAEAALTRAEREAFAAFSFEKRRQDWLLGRYAAKLAVARAAGREEELASVEVSRDENGHPRATFTGAWPDGWDLSLTHGHGRAAALVGPAAVGIDLERLRAIPPGGWRFFLTPRERDWLKEAPFGPHSEVVAWALKEAAYKAVQGRTQGMHHLTLDEVGRGEARIGHAGPEGPLVARYEMGAGFCLAIATPAPQLPAWLPELPPL